MTKDWESVCRRVHETAIESLQQFGRSPFVLEIYPHSSSEAIVWLEPQGLDDKGRAKLRLMTAAFRVTSPAAVLVCSDTWQVSDKFWKHYGLENVPAPEPRNTRYLEILDREYKGSLAYVPDELKGDALVTGIKGPRFMPITFFTFYHREGEKVVVDETADSQRMCGVWNIVPDWWESVIQ